MYRRLGIGGVLLAILADFCTSVGLVLQGQDSLFGYLLVVLAFTALRRERDLPPDAGSPSASSSSQSGATAGRGARVNPKQSSRNGLAKGFSLTALALAGVSVAISGWSVLTILSKLPAAFPRAALGCIAPQAMPNFRGLT